MCPDTISTPQGLLVCIPCACAVQWFKLLIAALKCFKAQVFDPIKDRVRAAMLDLIHNEREGDSVDHRLLKAIVSVLSQFLPGSMALILLSLRFFVCELCVECVTRCASYVLSAYPAVRMMC